MNRDVPAETSPGRATAGVDIAEDGPARRLRVLIVEDEALIAMELEDIVSDAGHDVVGVGMSCAQAVALAEALRPDVATMDVNLKGERDGISAALEIFQRWGIRSIIVSAYSGEALADRAAPAEPLGFLSKPVRHERLAALLQAAAMAR